MTLNDYLTRNQIPRLEFAERIGIDRSTLSRLLNGKRSASWQLAGTIEEATAGAVTRSDLRPDIYAERAA